MLEIFRSIFVSKYSYLYNFLHSRKEELAVGCPKITPSVKCSAPEAFSGAKLQVFMENGQKNEID